MTEHKAWLDRMTRSIGERVDRMEYERDHEGQPADPAEVQEVLDDVTALLDEIEAHPERYRPAPPRPPAAAEEASGG